MEPIDPADKRTKFSYFGEILPNNERSNAILAQRREEEQRRKEEAERVRWLALISLQLSQSSSMEVSNRNGIFVPLNFIDQTGPGTWRERTQEEGT